MANGISIAVNSIKGIPPSLNECKVIKKSHLENLGFQILGCWVTSGIPMTPQKDRYWEKIFSFPDSARLEFKITRGSWDKEAVTLDGQIPTTHSLVVIKDTVLDIAVEDWKDLLGE
jgi:hypothetical protein